MVTIFRRSAGLAEDGLTSPDVVYNRFGALYGSYTMLLLERSDNTKVYVPLHVSGRHAVLGLYLVQISTAESCELCDFVSRQFRVSKISWEYSLAPASGICRNHLTNHWTLYLPQTKDELWERMSSKSKQTLRRKERNLQKLLGVDALEFKEYSGRENISSSLVDTFFDYKRKLMAREYNMTAAEYLGRYHVTNAYTWTANGALVSIVLTCEQGDDVYLENLTYNPEYEKESPGFLLYGKTVERLVEKHKRTLMCGGGQQVYKQKFASRESVCYNVERYRSLWAALPDYTRKAIAKLLRVVRH